MASIFSDFRVAVLRAAGRGAFKVSLTAFGLASLTALLALGWAASPVLAEESAANYDLRLKTLVKSDNYLGDLTAKYVDFWPASRLPIKVYVHPPGQVDGYKPHYLDILKGVMSQWTEASGGKITFELVDAMPDSAIEVTWKASKDKKKGEYQEGVAQIFPDKDGIKRATVEIFTFPDDVSKNHADCVTTVGCIHEFGHALGIQGHSPAGKDLMCPEFRLDADLTPDKIKLTARDKATIMALVALGPRQDPRASAVAECLELNNQACKEINKGNFKSAIEKLEKCREKDPQYKLAVENLEVCYTNYALEKYSQKQYAETADLLTKRLDCLDQLGKPNKPDKPKLIETLTVYVFCLEKVGRADEAKKAQDRLDKLQGAGAK